MDILFDLTTLEKNEVLLIKEKISRTFSARVREIGAEDFSPIFLNLLCEMIKFSQGRGKTPDEFRAVLKYHFQEEGEKYYSFLVRLFKEIFEEFSALQPHFIEIAVNLALLDFLKKVPREELLVEGENLYVRKKRSL